MILSTLGGNCRVRSAAPLKGATQLVKAAGENRNPFYQVTPIAQPLVHTKVIPLEIVVPNTYDVATEKGKTYTFTAL